MQSLAFIWFDLQMTQRYLSDITFGSAQPRANSANLNTPIGAGTFRCPSVTQVPLVVSAKQRRLSCSPRPTIFRLISSWFGKAAHREGKNRREVVRSCR
jgi:hypothetical protein